MARNRIIGPATAREVRKPSRVADAAAHAEYREMIVAEIGRPDFRELHLDDGRPMGLFGLLMRPLSLFLLSIVALTSLYAFKLWREGWFEQFRQPEVPVVEAPQTSWIAGRGQAPPIEDRVPEVKPRPAPGPPTTEDTEESDEADADASADQ